jgi:hypothetical protein
MTAMMLRLLLLVSLLPVLGCPKFDAPPQPTILGIEDGTLESPAAPITVGWHEAIDPATLHLRIVRLDLTPEGDLDPNAEVFFEHGPSGDSGGTGTLGANEAFFTISVDGTLPVATQLAVVIEPGLADKEGNSWTVRQTLKFTFAFACGEGNEAATAFPARSVHFMLIDVDSPVQVQLQLLADIRIDPATGAFVGQFTNADRDAASDCSPYGLSCNAATEVCRTVPEPACVEPSKNAATVEEYVDYTFNNVLPEGYSFTVEGCIRDQEDGSFALANVPADIEVVSPPVNAHGIEFGLSFRLEDGVLRGQGSFKAADVLLGTTSLGAGVGSCVMREVPEAEVPEGLPEPPAD